MTTIPQADPRVLLPGQNPKLDRSFDLGELLWHHALGRTMFLEVVMANGNVATAVRRGWASGREPSGKSCAMMVARLKAFEGVVRASPTGMTVGPTDDLLGSGFKGWVRYEEMVFAGSAQSSEEDLLCALLMTMPRAFLEPVLHHVGFSYATLDEMVSAVMTDEWETGLKATWPEASDLIRAYTWRPYSAHVNGGYWVERIFRPWREGTPEVSAHVDLVTGDPMGILNFVAGHLGIVPQVFSPAWENGPAGYVFVPGRDMPIGMMTRGSWWEIPMFQRPENLDAEVRRILSN